MTLYSLSPPYTRVVPTSFQDLGLSLLEVASCSMTSQPSQRHHVSLPGIFSSSIPSFFFSLNKQKKLPSFGMLAKMLKMCCFQLEWTDPSWGFSQGRFWSKANPCYMHSYFVFLYLDHSLWIWVTQQSPILQRPRAHDKKVILSQKDGSLEDKNFSTDLF